MIAKELATLAVVIACFCAAGGTAQCAQPVESVRRLVSVQAAAGRKPVVVFDIDDTLVRVTPRTKRILEVWADLLGAGEGTAARIARLDPDRMPYPLEGALDQAGIDEHRQRASATRFWKRWFFSNDFLTCDRPVPGAVLLVRELVHRGAVIVYLTGRDEERMGAGTRQALRALGFPIGAQTILMMKPRALVTDLAFKQQACARIRTLGTVVALFDNEPGNVNAFAKEFAGALVVLLETTHSPGAPQLAPGIPRIPDFRTALRGSPGSGFRISGVRPRVPSGRGAVITR